MSTIMSILLETEETRPVSKSRAWRRICERAAGNGVYLPFISSRRACFQVGLPRPSSATDPIAPADPVTTKGRRDGRVTWLESKR